VQKLKPEHFAHDKGHLYESELHIHPDHMLDWDKPISEHHPYVQGRLQKMFGLPEGYVPDTMGGWVNADRATGRDVHDVLAKHPGGHDRPAAAQQLLDAGIPGIKYLDSGSRTHAADAQRLRNQIAMMGPGTPQRDIDVAHQRLAQTEARISHNYVVFDPRTINIVKRNGLPGMQVPMRCAITKRAADGPRHYSVPDSPAGRRRQSARQVSPAAGSARQGDGPAVADPARARTGTDPATDASAVTGGTGQPHGAVSAGTATRRAAADAAAPGWPTAA
jgi:hypothetical protein